VLTCRLEKPECAINNGQSRDTGNTGLKIQSEFKSQLPSIFDGKPVLDKSDIKADE
jgi:hypothetical protein